ncbi:hypothetical protein ACO0LL_13780 [Undibacterium sp. TC4M20W]|uniref:hypothetical protein n=1 Tax=Undibacterium TaxID=401469 RepID=UPI003BEF4F28
MSNKNQNNQGTPPPQATKKNALPVPDPLELKQIQLYRAIRTMQDMDWAMEKLSAYRTWIADKNTDGMFEQDKKAIPEALLHSAVVAYIRPFSGNRADGFKVKSDNYIFPEDDATEDQKLLHEKLQTYRDTSLAHSDAGKHKPKFKFNKKGEWVAKFEDISPKDIDPDEFMGLMQLIHNHANITVGTIVDELKSIPNLPIEYDINEEEFNYALRISTSASTYEPPIQDNQAQMVITMQAPKENKDE